MAWYRCGGGGIPSSLKGDMNDVFNKKFGTVLQDYPPEDWPGTVNLMGPLPEKTVSGSVVTFSDGADDVPLKSCAVTIAPTLTGVSSVDVVSAGKNFASELYEYSSTNMIISPIFLKAGEYTVSFQRSTTVNAIYIRKGETVSLAGTAYAHKYNTTFFTFTADEDTYYFVQIYRSGTSTSWEDAPVTNAQIEVGSDVTAYEAYEAPTTHTANLGRTIYGGSVDVVNGTGTDENGNEFTFTPVPIITRLGDNTLWSDGDLSVTYRRDIDLALAQ